MAGGGCFLRELREGGGVELAVGLEAVRRLEGGESAAEIVSVAPVDDARREAGPVEQNLRLGEARPVVLRRRLGRGGIDGLRRQPPAKAGVPSGAKAATQAAIRSGFHRRILSALSVRADRESELQPGGLLTSRRLATGAYWPSDSPGCGRADRGGGGCRSPDRAPPFQSAVLSWSLVIFITACDFLLFLVITDLDGAWGYDHVTLAMPRKPPTEAM